MKKTGQHKLLKVLFCGFWVIGLGAITLLLLMPTGEERDFAYHVKLFGVAVLWLAFIAYAFGFKGILNWNIVAARYDKLFFLVPLALFFVILLVLFIQALLGLNLFAAFLLGIFIYGLFNAMKDMVTSIILCTLFGANRND